MSDMLDKEDPGPTYAEVQAALDTAEATITSLRAELERKDAALRFYSDEDLDGYDFSVIDYGLSVELGKIIKDGGKIARAALSPAQKEGEA